ncbi:hypothetical protein BV22DRAFT_1041464 [Leucogyrophana mollusca]|uniref:Uncharacterized protein n=1 Tax=Leucogyrophana mollusca TaxID=85980 RepID=A0ACB8AZ70_9AGAM|nr:hypothetical protein BV22DRAFT_1041464 [Leucogyrophana mollusca]
MRQATPSEDMCGTTLLAGHLPSSFHVGTFTCSIKHPGCHNSERCATCSTPRGAYPAELAPLEAVYLAWLLRVAQGAEYVKQARENGRDRECHRKGKHRGVARGRWGIRIVMG